MIWSECRKRSGLTPGKVVIAGVRPPSADGERLLAFVLHRENMSGFLPLARQLTRA